ncbi:hypothetical protein BJV77DRAFT_1077785 [Russula vinacea]|nr:hypothetical protein BJV77DRAFT_1077785 [Russula vinacea]
MSSSTDPRENNPLESQSGEPSKNELKKRAKAAEKERKAAEKAAKLAEQQREKAEAEEREAKLDFAREFYGKLPLNQSQSRHGVVRHQIVSLSSDLDGKTVTIRARVFLKLRQRTDSVQAMLSVEEGKVSKFMVKWASGLSDESIVLVEGIVQKSPEEVKGATIKDVELILTRIHLTSFSIDDASRADGEKDENPDAQFNRVLLDTRLNNRVVDLRTQTNQAIFKLQAAIGAFFREYLDSQGFIEIHSPKLQGAATESGASVFKVSYFKGNAFLAQSPQLAKQMAIAADFERVYEIGPVFRAEDSNTHRHLTEFVGLDLEMTIEEHYHEVLEMLDGLFKHLFQNLKEKYQKDIDAVGAQFPAEEFKWKEETLKLTFSQAVDLLVEDGVERSVLDDINTENEKRLGRIVKAKYDTDYFIIDKFPMALRPFYTMPDPNSPELSNSYDFFMRGEEILSGAQRIHDASFLAEKMREKGVDPESMKRVLMLFLKLNNVRRASLFPRDPKRLEP